MKKVIYGTLFLGLVLLMFSCSKENISKQVEFSESEMVWVTPDGHVIPAIERHEWEKYVANNFPDSPTNPQEKPGGYVSQQCFTETIKCGLKCVAAKKGSDCTKASECAACMNCGCTPIENPYTK